jgi:hypothetical protein
MLAICPRRSASMRRAVPETTVAAARRAASGFCVFTAGAISLCQAYPPRSRVCCRCRSSACAALRTLTHGVDGAGEGAGGAGPDEVVAGAHVRDDAAEVRVGVEHRELRRGRCDVRSQQSGDTGAARQHARMVGGSEREWWGAEGRCDAVSRLRSRQRARWAATARARATGAFARSRAGLVAGGRSHRAATCARQAPPRRALVRGAGAASGAVRAARRRRLHPPASLLRFLTLSHPQP